MVSWLVGLSGLVRWFVGSLVLRFLLLVGWLVRWLVWFLLVGWSVGWLGGLLDSWLAGWLVLWNSLARSERSADLQ